MCLIGRYVLPEGGVKQTHFQVFCLPVRRLFLVHRQIGCRLDLSSLDTTNDLFAFTSASLY